MPSAQSSPVERLTVALAFLLPILATLALYLPSGPLMPARIALVLLVGLALWRLWRGQGWPAPRVSLVVAVVAACFLAFGALGWVRYPGGSVTEAAAVALTGAGAVAATVLVSRRMVTALLLGWLASAAIAAPVALWELATAQHLPRSVGAVAYQSVAGWNEITSWFDNPNLYAYHCALVLLLIPLLPAAARMRWWLVGCAAVLLGLLLRTNGQLALAAVALGVAWWCLATRRGRVALGVGGAVLAGTAMLRVPPGGWVVRAAEVALDGLQWEGKTSYIRASLARTAWWVAEQTNYLGAGPGGFERWAAREEAPSYATGFSNAHFGMLEVLANYGIVTLAALVGVMAVGVWWAAGARKWLPEPTGRVAYGAGALALTVPVLSMTHSTWLVQPVMWVHLVTIVAVFALSASVPRVAESPRHD